MCVCVCACCVKQLMQHHTMREMLEGTKREIRKTQSIQMDLVGVWGGVTVGCYYSKTHSKCHSLG